MSDQTEFEFDPYVDRYLAEGYDLSTARAMGQADFYAANAAPRPVDESGAVSGDHVVYPSVTSPAPNTVLRLEVNR